MNNRAYSLLTIKRADDGARILEGTATTPTPDRMNDVIEPLGVVFRNPLPLLWQHRPSEPVGAAVLDTPTRSGIKFSARITQVEEPGRLKSRLDEAWQSVKTGLVRAVSIGFRAVETAPLGGGGIRFLKTEVLELSLVTIPANSEATITNVRSLCQASRASEREPIRDRDRTAMHEAGHGVIMQVTGTRCRYATIEGQPHAKWGNGSYTPRARALVAMAGSIAAVGNLDEMSTRDRKILHDAIEEMNPSGAGVPKIVRELEQEARRLVAKYDGAIRTVADKIAKQGTAWGYEISSAIAHPMRTPSHQIAKAAPQEWTPYTWRKGEILAVGDHRYRAKRDCMLPPWKAHLSWERVA